MLDATFRVLYKYCMSEVTLITTSQVADKYQITPSAVRRWVAAGKLTPAVTTPGGHYRFNPAEVEALLNPAASA